MRWIFTPLFFVEFSFPKLAGNDSCKILSLVYEIYSMLCAVRRTTLANYKILLLVFKEWIWLLRLGKRCLHSAGLYQFFWMISWHSHQKGLTSPQSLLNVANVLKHWFYTVTPLRLLKEVSPKKNHPKPQKNMIIPSWEPYGISTVWLCPVRDFEALPFQFITNFHYLHYLSIYH